MSKTTTTTQTTDTTVQAQPIIPLPSADLINFRFDSTDKQMVLISQKLDKMSNSYLTKEEAGTLRAERMTQITALENRVEKLEESNILLVATDNRQQGAIDTTKKYTAFGLAFLSLLLTIVAIYFGIHK